MRKLVTEIKITDLDEIKTFFELISDNQACISDPLRTLIQQWLEKTNNAWVKWSDISPEFISSTNCLVLLNGVEQFYVTGYNKILKKVKIYNKKESKIDIVKAESFSINNLGCENFVEWGNE